jgi:cysteinyl-tRNA synthetase
MLKSKKIDLPEIEDKILVRNDARASKNYQLSDKIRDELLIVGIELKDNPDGSTDWSVKI